MNKPGGYWIAEADPAAAEHALTRHLSPAEAPWCVLATDGAYKPMEHLGLDNWSTVATADSDDLTATLRRCQDWEAMDGEAIDSPERNAMMTRP